LARRLLTSIVEHMATKGDLIGLKNKLRAELASKKDLFTLQTQVNSIEREIREMKHDYLGIRVSKLEEKVFGKSRT
jgi:hypothetical protein